MRTDILGYNIYRSWSEPAGPNLHPEARSVSTSLSSVISLLKLPREVLENVLILTSCLWLGTGWKCSRKLDKTKKEGAVSSTCANIFPQHLSSSKLAKKSLFWYSQ